ncbi:serine hydrolase [Tropicimonas sp. IMCC6043]|uniref:serine hydrolase n=1 Tax=Tropicimonas sp. IMCC6043 TaxID=2510645 RepID=UPI0013EA40D1|nr:serine hydrolase [Tropicimonas sp. IMCC6043]
MACISVAAEFGLGIAATKPVTAWAMHNLTEEKLVDLDAPIEDYLAGWQPPPSDFDHSKVAARAILAHGAGRRR